MNDSNVRRWTGACGEAAGDLLLVASPLYVVMGTPPTLGNEALFAAGLCHLIRRVRPDDE